MGPPGPAGPPADDPVREAAFTDIVRDAIGTAEFVGIRSPRPDGDFPISGFGQLVERRADGSRRFILALRLPIDIGVPAIYRAVADGGVIPRIRLRIDSDPLLLVDIVGAALIESVSAAEADKPAELVLSIVPIGRITWTYAGVNRSWDFERDRGIGAQAYDLTFVRFRSPGTALRADRFIPPAQANASELGIARIESAMAVDLLDAMMAVLAGTAAPHPTASQAAVRVHGGGPHGSSALAAAYTFVAARPTKVELFGDTAAVELAASACSIEDATGAVETIP
jgi:hypothetical protein